MNLAEAKRHAEHLCDVWSEDETVEHIGVIERIRSGRAKVSGHPECGARWLPLESLGTSCKLSTPTKETN